MTEDGWTKNDPASVQRKTWPRWLIPVFIVDTIIVAGVLYYVFGRSNEVAPINPNPTAGEVRGEMIDAAPTKAAVAKSDDSDEWANDNWTGDDWDENEWDDVPVSISTGETSAISGSPGAAIAAMFGGGISKPLPRPRITKPEYSDYTPANYDDIGNWQYKRVWPPPPAGTPPRDDAIPADIQKWSGRKIAIAGYMQPLKIDDNRVSQFMLMRSQALCCFGATITLVDWIEVTAPAGQSYEPMLHKPITVLGPLDVGEEMIDGFTVSLFRMTPDTILPPGESP